MASPYIGQIEAYPYNFAPKNWQPCQGQLLPIAQNQALFSLLGTTYGGNGINSFALPDLRGRVAMGQGQGAGLTPREIGEPIGEQTHTLLISEIPQHFHTLNAAANALTAGNTDIPANNVALANATGSKAGVDITISPYVSGAPNTTMAPTALGTAGGSQPHPNAMPYLALGFCIAMTGSFPSRN